MSPSLHRLTTLLLVSAYLTANTIGGLLHDHDGHCQSHRQTCDHGHHHADEGSHGGEVGLADCSGGNALHDEDCAVCRALGQRPMPVIVSPLGALCQLRVELAVEGTPRPAIALPRTTHSRAPPAVG